MQPSEIGIILANLGSPDSCQVRDVRRYLQRFLMDPLILPLPYLLRALLVWGDCSLSSKSLCRML